jgi:lipoprotein-releasing system permease protein
MTFKLYLWISAKLLFNRKFFFGGSAPLSILGLVLGVAALIASQSVMRGFEVSLKKAMIDVTADVQIVKKGRLIDDWAKFSSAIKKIQPDVTHIARFAYAEAVLADRGRVSGVLLQGMSSSEMEDVLNLTNRLKVGYLPKKDQEIAIGIGLAKKFNLKLNDVVYLAVPLATPFESHSFRRRSAEFIVSGIVDLGKNDWNDRLILSNLRDLQKLIEIGDRYTGAFVKIKNSDLAIEASVNLSEKLGPKYNVMNWFDVNRNLFYAVGLEKIAIFFVVFLIVIVAAFNISSTLYVLIRQRYKDISILKTVGFSSRSIRRLFLIQGFIIGTVGSFLGFVLGLLLCLGFMFLQTKFSLISGSVYKIDRIDVSVSAIDFLIIYLSALSACLLAAYLPAQKGASLQIVEGLRED